MSPPFMSFDLAKSIIDEAAGNGFAGIFRFSENGEALLNREFLAIFKYFRKELPQAKSDLFTNMGLLTKDKSQELLSLGLDQLHTNIDGASKATFEFTTKLNFETVTGNLHDLIDNREHAITPCRISIYILTGHNYMRTVEGKRIDLPDDADQVIDYWRPHLAEGDRISVVDSAFKWARVEEEPVRKSTPCRQFDRCAKECFIAPNGDVYLCCQDHQYKCVFGNVANASVMDVWNSARRRETIEFLGKMDFRAIGQPCEFCPD